MIAEEELAEIVFKGLGGEKDEDGAWIISFDTRKLDSNYIAFFTIYELRDFIFAFPVPCAFGLVVDAAEKLGWSWDYRGGWFSMHKWGSGLVEGHRTTQYEWQKNNPMWAVCLAFKEVLDKEGKLDEN